MWESLLAVMAAVCCVPCLRSRRKKKKPCSPGLCSPNPTSPSPLSPNRVSDVLKEDLSELGEEPLVAVETGNSVTTSLVEDGTQEETTDPSGTAISPPSKAFETEADHLYDYNLNQVPPELSGLQGSDFLEDPDEPNIALLPKHVLVRIVEMLSPKEFGALAQTCRFLHWRLMKWCHSSVKELKIEIRQDGNRSNGEARIEMSPRMGYNLYRKHIQFQRVNFFIWIPDGVSRELFQKLSSMFGPYSNVKHAEVTYITPGFIDVSQRAIPYLRKLLRNTQARRLNWLPSDDFKAGKPITCGYRVEQQNIPALYKQKKGQESEEQQERRDEYELYLFDVPLKNIEMVIKSFLSAEEVPDCYHEFFCSHEERGQLEHSLHTIRWAKTARGISCEWHRCDPDEMNVLVFGEPGEKQRNVSLLCDRILLMTGIITFSGPDWRLLD